MPKHKAKLQQQLSFDPCSFVRNLSLDLFGEEISDLRAFQEYTEGFIVRADMQSDDIRHTIRVRQAEAIFKKNASWPGSTVELRRQSALDAFAHGERVCRLANKRLKFYEDHWSRRPSIWKYIEKAREDIHELLGPLTPSGLHRLFEASGFGSGSTFNATSGFDKSLPRKLELATVTKDCLPYFQLARKRVFPNWDCIAWEVVNGNRIATVPKSSQTDRPIAVEPSLNVFLQKGVDNCLKAKLRRWGINLNDQSLNQKAARSASIDGRLATIDLASASDTLSLELVRLLVPYDWFIYLTAIRSPMYYLNGGWHEYAKFSSMGNATTFPIETMIFAALARAILGPRDSRDLRVYGDDIIMPSQSALLMFELLRFCGFTPNRSKSFLFGPFRESCGVDFVSGVDVRPVYVKEWPRTLAQLFNLHNRLFSHRRGLPLTRTLEYLRSCSHLYLVGPPDIGASLSFDWYAGKAAVYDGYFFSNTPSRLKMLTSGAHGYKVRRLVTKYEPLSGFSERPLYLSFLLGVGERALRNVQRCRTRVVTVELPSWNTGGSEAVSYD